jgi:hypothetical protein
MTGMILAKMKQREPFGPRCTILGQEVGSSHTARCEARLAS